MRVPAEVLAKTGDLTADDHRVLEQHPQYGADLLTRYAGDAVRERTLPSTV